MKNKKKSTFYQTNNNLSGFLKGGGEGRGEKRGRVVLKRTVFRCSH